MDISSNRRAKASFEQIDNHLNFMNDILTCAIFFAFAFASADTSALYSSDT